jgi:hypothetical protein
MVRTALRIAGIAQPTNPAAMPRLQRNAFVMATIGRKIRRP